MKKMFFWSGGAVFALLATLPMFAAFEAHVINVVAQIDPGVIVVDPGDELDFGIVFPQEQLDKNLTVSLSSTFLSEVTGIQYASSAVTSSQGLRKNGTIVLPARSNPNAGLGTPQTTGAAFDSPVPAETNFFSLGFGGTVTLGFTNFIVNEAGADIKVYEVTGGPPYPDERVRVEASQDGLVWTLLAASALKDADIDLSSLAWAKFVRLTDVSDISLFEETADGYDLDAVRATSRTTLGTVDYVVRQKPKCADDIIPTVHPQVTEDAQGNFICPAGSHVMPLLCPYLSKHETTNDPGINTENDGPGINAFHGLPGPWNLTTAVTYQIAGKLDRITQDLSDTWNIDLKVPCFTGSCAQDWAAFVRAQNAQADPAAYTADPNLEHQTYGCDLWIEVIDFE